MDKQIASVRPDPSGKLALEAADATDWAPMRVVGPTIPRWSLGEQLTKLRDNAQVSYDRVAEELGLSVSQIRKMESGDRKVRKSDLTVMLSLYGVEDEQHRDFLHELQKLSDQRGWWTPYGGIQEKFAIFLSLEGSAVAIKGFEPSVVHGLFQTEDYTRAIAIRDRRIGELTPEQAETEIEIKTQRQQTVFGGDEQPQLHVIFDEAALRRVVGGPEVMATQLEHIVELTKATNVRVQVVPYDQGAHPGQFGAFEIFEFDEELHSPIVYVEGQAGSNYLEKADDLRRCSLSFDDLTASALSPRDSVRMIAGIARELGKHAEG